MKDQHLSAWEQEEYVLGTTMEYRTPQMVRHLSECLQCRTAVESLEQGIAGFKAAAMQWSLQQLAHRPQQPVAVRTRRLPVFQWAFAAMIPVLMLILMLVPFHSAPAPRAVPQMSEDALLDQVDEQVSVEVPSSMESLTHLVSTSSSPAQ